MSDKTSEVIVDADTECSDATLAILNVLSVACPSNEHAGAMSALTAVETLGDVFGILFTNIPEEEVSGYLSVFIMKVADRHPWVEGRLRAHARDSEAFRIWKNQ
jgi:hypothetical protein